MFWLDTNKKREELVIYMVSKCMYYRYIGKDVPHQNLKHNQIVFGLDLLGDRILILNCRTNQVQYVSKELFNKYFKLSSDKYYL